MEVIATAVGFHDKVREPGEKFSVPAGSKASWFTPVVAKGKQKPAEKTEGEQESSGDGSDLV